MQEEKISLFYKDARSDKEYHAQLQAKDGGYVVNFQYGKRGGTLTEGSKTASGPVDYARAKKAYDAVVKEKLGKGYTPADTATAYVGTSLEERFTGIVPQLLNPVDETGLQALLADPAWVLQEKHDGHRRMLRHDGTERFSINRKGLAVGMPDEVAKGFEALASLAPLTLDGEMMGTVYAIFDVLELSGEDLRPLPYEVRLAKLDALEKVLRDAGVPDTFYVTHTARTEEEKRLFYATLKATKAEGAVGKRLDAAYVAGRPNSGGNQVKRKFVQSATVLVTKPHATKRSVSVEVYDEAGHPVALGNVTIPPNYDVPQAGALVEVEYLYAYPGGSLYQPQYKGVRDDLEPSAASVGQLHYKRGTDDEDEGDA